jgi:hypothetical protein
MFAKSSLRQILRRRVAIVTAGGDLRTSPEQTAIITTGAARFVAQRIAAARTG